MKNQDHLPLDLHENEKVPGKVEDIREVKTSQEIEKQGEELNGIDDRTNLNKMTNGNSRDCIFNQEKFTETSTTEENKIE